MRRQVLSAFWVSLVGVPALLLVIWQAPTHSADVRLVVQSYIDSHQRAIVSELTELVAIPNTPSDVENIRLNAEHLRGLLRERGFRAQLIETAGHPLVYGELTVPQATRTLLVWAHYNGQSVDPRRWNQANPFVPVLRAGRLEDGARVLPNFRRLEKFEPDWRLYGSSVSDDKGPIIALLTALDALKSANLSPTSNIRVLLDGEGDSLNRPTAIQQNREKFAADLMLVLEGPGHQSGKPTVAFGMRGILQFELTVYGPKVGVHSGYFGNWVPNPSIRLVHLLATMKDNAGRVLIKDFYDGIVPLTPEEQAMIDAVPDDPVSLMKEFGIAAVERPDLSLQQALQLPALNLRGLSSAYVGTDARTMIPDRAIATIDVRLVPETPLAATAARIRAHLRDQGYQVVESDPSDATRAQFPLIAKVVMGVGVNGYRVSPLAPESRLVVTALRNVFGEPPVQIRTMGGTAPIASFVEVLGFPAITLPTVNVDDNQRAGNENLRLGHLFNGIITIAAVLTM